MIILVADDTDDIRLMVRVMLENKGHRVVEAEHGREAVELAIREHPDVILMDLSMPVIDRIEATRRLRAARNSAHADYRGHSSLRGSRLLPAFGSL